VLTSDLAAASASWPESCAAMAIFSTAATCPKIISDELTRSKPARSIVSVPAGRRGPSPSAVATARANSLDSNGELRLIALAGYELSADKSAWNETAEPSEDFDVHSDGVRWGTDRRSGRPQPLCGLVCRWVIAFADRDKAVPFHFNDRHRGPNPFIFRHHGPNRGSWSITSGS
jgi:hypothetical protein